MPLDNFVQLILLVLDDKVETVTMTSLMIRIAVFLGVSLRTSVSMGTLGRRAPVPAGQVGDTDRRLS